MTTHSLHSDSTPDRSLHDDDTCSGQPSYIGYEYQILATAWLGLKLTSEGIAEAVVVEPDSGEDVAAILDPTSEPDPEAASSLISLPNLQIQIKFRSESVWTPAKLKPLLESRNHEDNRGPAPRPRAYDYLQQYPFARFLLVTNSDVNPDLRNFKVTEIGADSDASKRVGGEDDPSLAKRIGILAQQTPELLAHAIRERLQSHFHVPGDKTSACQQKLESHVRDRLLGKRPRRFPFQEMQAIIREHGGNVPPPKEPIPPRTLGEIRASLHQRHALVLVGLPGLGKTTLAESLIHELEINDPPVQKITISGSEQFDLVRKKLTSPGNHLFYFEDPWGQDHPKDTSAAITTELPRWMLQARPGKWFVVTSRLPVFRAATKGKDELYKPFVNTLCPEDYNDDARRAIYERQIISWSNSHRQTAVKCCVPALKHLETPYSIERFCYRLGAELNGGNSHPSDNEIRKWAKQSNVESFGIELRNQIASGGAGDISSAIVIWALLIAGNLSIRIEDVQTARSELKAGGLISPPDVTRLFNGLADAKWFQSRSLHYVTTPSVVEALATFESDEPAAFEDTTAALISSWIASEKFDAVLACVKAAAGKRSVVPEAAAQAFDAYLTTRAIYSDGYQFRYAFHDLARYGSTQSAAGLLIEALSHGLASENRPLNWLNSRPQWSPPQLDASIVASITSDAMCCSLAKRFVIDYLPHEAEFSFLSQTYVPDQIVSFLSQFEWPIKEWLLQAFEESVSAPYEGTEFVIDGLCPLAPDAINSIFERCLSVFADTFELLSQNNEADDRSKQGETDPIHESIYEQNGEELSRAQRAVKSAFRFKLSRDGFGWIPKHHHRDLLLHSWRETLEGRSDPNNGEILSYLNCCDNNTTAENAFELLMAHPSEAFFPWIIRAILEFPEGVPGYWHLIIERTERSARFVPLLNSEIRNRKLGFVERARSAIALLPKPKPIHLRERSETLHTPSPFQTQAVSCFLSPPEAEIISACRTPKDLSRDFALDDSEFEAALRELIVNWPPNLGILAVQLWNSQVGDPEPFLDPFLEATAEIRRDAWNLCRNRRRLLENGLQDSDSHCRVTVLEALAINADDEEQTAILALETDKSAFVRKSVARQIGEHGWRQGIPVLLRLLEDEREFGDRYSEDDYRIFEVARTAEHSLAEFIPWSDEVRVAVCQFLEKGHASSVDHSVHGRLLRRLALQPTEETFEFCVKYVQEIWWQTRWKENRGHDLVSECLHTLAELLVHQPAWSHYLNWDLIARMATENLDDSGWLTAPSWCLLAVADSSVEPIINRLAEDGSIDQYRAQLIVAGAILSPKSLPEVIFSLLAETDPLLQLSRAPGEIIWEDFSGREDFVRRQEHPLEATPLDPYQDWIISRLFINDLSPQLAASLPHRYFLRPSAIS